MPNVALTPRAPRATQFLIVLLTVGVFAAVVAFVTAQLRRELRAQILNREAEALAAVAAMQMDNSAAELAKLGLTDAPGELADVALKTSRLRGVLGIRVFDAEKKLVEAAPWVWSEEAPAAADWMRLAAHESIARFHSVPLPAAAALVTDAAAPLLEAWVPLARSDARTPAGAAQFVINGGGVAAEFATLDRRLAMQAWLAWLAGALVIALALAWAFRRLAAAHDALAARSEDLARANRELALAAKTSALGAVTAHLIHEIKTPVAGLESFVASQAENGVRGDFGAEQAAAQQLTRRLRTMINDVVAVLHDEQHGAHFALTCREIAEHALGQARSVADASGVELAADISATVALPGRQANLVGLVLRNLLQNAIEASRRGGVVRLTSQAHADGAVEFCVEDSGSGLAEAVRAKLFEPVASTKRGGSGLGLALSAQLAQQAGGRLELARSDSHGTSFRLVLSKLQ